jgi:signal transduction histidine kinase
VLLAATAEIEQYTRVQCATTNDEIAIVGHVAADLVHLLAELIDNATAFSPPHSVVHVTAHLVDSGVVVAVEDDGVGMGASRLAAANHRLATPAGADAAVPEQMGLFVVAHLGARHGIRTELHHSSDGGIVAVTWLPAGLLTTATVRLAYPPATGADPRADDSPPSGGRRGWRRAAVGRRRRASGRTGRPRGR